MTTPRPAAAAAADAGKYI